MKPIDLTKSRRVAAAMRMARETFEYEDVRDVLDNAVRAFERMYGSCAYMQVSMCDVDSDQFRIRRFLRHDGRDLVPRTDTTPDFWSAPLFEGGLVPELTHTREPKVYQELDVPKDPALGDWLAPYRSLMAAPMFTGGEAMDWIIMLHPDPHGCTLQTAVDMILLSNLLAMTINLDYLTRDLTEAHDRIQREVDEIARIQRSLLPHDMPKIPGLSLAASYETFDRAGGDYYDVLPLRRIDGEPDPEGPWAFIIADASGHGPAAAVVMAMVHALFHSYSEQPHSPAEFLEHINANLQSHRVGYSFVTAFLAIYDPHTRRLTYANAGHPPPILMEPGADAASTNRFDDLGGIPLGIEKDVRYETGEIVLKPGQSVVFYTDGITESTDPNGEMFRVEGIEEALRTCNGKAECVTLEVIDALKTHEAGTRSRDDQTLLAVHLEV